MLLLVLRGTPTIYYGRHVFVPCALADDCLPCFDGLASVRIEQGEYALIASRFVLIAATIASLGLLGFADAPQAAPTTTKHRLSQSHYTGYPALQHSGRLRLRRGAGPGLQPDYQFYFDTPGYFPGFYPAAGLAPDLDPPLVGSGFAAGPLGVH